MNATETYYRTVALFAFVLLDLGVWSLIR